MGLYSKKGLYSGYNKAHKEREELDYYATPTEEVINILETIGNTMFDNATVLEPCAGGGHMLRGIKDYSTAAGKNWKFVATDIKKRCEDEEILTGDEFNFIGDDYPYAEGIDYIVMNPPFSIIEPFVIRALEIADKGVVMFGRLQFLEGKGRYENILKDTPPSDVYVYVDRVHCGKNGDFSNKNSIQAYAWYYWNKENNNKDTRLHFIRRK